MDEITKVSDLRARVRDWRQAGEGVALVPTMGNLHQGHLTLVHAARGIARRTLVSIFVNPLQFGPREDFAAYPRTLERDRALLSAAGVDLLFAPGVGDMYPDGQASHTRVEVPGISDILCGASRPGHFVGVATVVCKLFNLVQPDHAVFGDKDFQQLLVIRRMVADLAIPVTIHGVATVREPDGLAMSSRNGYLSGDERARAPLLAAVLTQAAQRLRQGEGIAEVEGWGAQELAAGGFDPEYVAVRRAADLGEPIGGEEALVVLGAARLGKTRLIDNILVRD